MSVIDSRTTRRALLRSGAGAAGAVAVSPGLLGRGLEAMAKVAVPGDGPYGPLGGPDGNGLRLPAGFSSRLIARGDQPVPGTAYPWHIFSDAMGTFATPDGGFLLVSNSEVLGGLGGVSAIRFGAGGTVSDAYRILSGTSTNCAGGVTPWGTWLSCEEVEDGLVWECDPSGATPPRSHQEMGVFTHEAACVDPKHQRLYLTEDEWDAGFYRFTPAAYPDLSAGALEIASVNGKGLVDWLPVPDPSASAGPLRDQVPGATRFRRGEGMWFDRGTVYMATTSDDRVWAYDTETREIEVLYDGEALGEGAPLHDVDNLTVSVSGDLFVAEDTDDLNICLISPEGEVAPFLQLTGDEHTESELTGPVFDPSGGRFYFASQRAFGSGAIYEVTGPFRLNRPDLKPPRLRVAVLGKPSPRDVAESGLPVRIRVVERESRPTSVEARLMVGLGGRRKVEVARAKRRVAAQKKRFRLRLRPTDAGQRRLRGRRELRGSLVVTATDAAGNRRKVVRRVRLD